MSKSAIKDVPYKTVVLFHEIAQILEPQKPMTVSQWADENRVLSSKDSAEPGKWRTDRAPYQREIMDCVTDNEIEDVIIKSSAQVGKTAMMLNIAGYYMDYEPAPILLVQPTLDLGDSFSKDRLAPMIKETKCLNDKVADSKSRDSGNTIREKSYPGGQITITGANSAAGLASRPIRIVLLDEIDRYPDSAGTEGDPIILAEKRTNTYWNRKLIKFSTPTDENTSKIEKEFLKGTQEEWCVQCPCCGKYQPYIFERVNFKNLAMECYFCKEQVGERDWKEQPHKWIPKNPDAEKIRSFHLNEMCSPWKSWAEIIKDFKEANEDYKKTGLPNKLKAFVNTSLGECWKEKGDGADEEALLKRREKYDADIPNGVVLITAGVDVQDDRLEIELVGWGKGLESWGLYKHVIHGDPKLDGPWMDLEEFYDSKHYFKNGYTLKCAAACVDTGGHCTNRAYQFIRDMEKKNKRIYGIKGYADTPGIPLIYKKTKVDIKNTKGIIMDTTHIFILGVDAGKDDVIARLKINIPGPGYCHFPSNIDRGYNQTYMQGLTSEEKVTKTIKNKLKTVWVKKQGVRNEPLDMRNYAYAAVLILNPNWESLSKKIDNGIDYTEASATSSQKRRRRGAVNSGIQV